MDIRKVCFKCGRELPLSDFYKASHMADGHLNKCKDCTKEDVRMNYLKKSADPAYMEKERARGREKYARLGYQGRKSDKQKQKSQLYKSLRNAKASLKIRIPATEELHHWDYNQIRSVIQMPRSLHHRLHTMIRLKVEEGIYYHNGEKLDTIEKHLRVVRQACETFGYDPSRIVIHN